VPYLRQSVTDLSHRMPIFDPRQFHVGLAVEKVALRQVFLHLFGFLLSGSLHQCSISVTGISIIAVDGTVK